MRSAPGTPQRTITPRRATTYARGPDILAYFFLAVASFWRCPACPERPSDQAELARYRPRSDEAFHRRAGRRLRDLMPFPFSHERLPSRPELMDARTCLRRDHFDFVVRYITLGMSCVTRTLLSDLLNGPPILVSAAGCRATSSSHVATPARLWRWETRVWRNPVSIETSRRPFLVFVVDLSEFGIDNIFVFRRRRGPR